MRFVVALALCLAASQAGGDVFVVNFEFPESIDVQAARAELVDQLPVLSDETSRSSISAYRQELDRYNTTHIKGLYSRIQGICTALNEVERASNKEWDSGNISRNEKLDIDERIASEREKCSDRHWQISPYFTLYYELVEIYKRKDEESVVLLSACNNRDECRNR